MTKKCKQKGCLTEMSGGPYIPNYCPEHNNKNQAAVSLGKLTSEKKAKAARENGKKGGQEKSAAVLTIFKANEMNKKGRKAIAEWLRNHAEWLEEYGEEYSPLFRGRYLYFQEKTPHHNK